MLGQMPRQQKLGLEDDLNDLVCTEGDDLAIALIYSDVGHSRCMTLQSCRLKLASRADCPLLLLQASAEGQLNTCCFSLTTAQHLMYTCRTTNPARACTPAEWLWPCWTTSRIYPPQCLHTTAVFARCKRSELHASLVSSAPRIAHPLHACVEGCSDHEMQLCRHAIMKPCLQG